MDKFEKEMLENNRKVAIATQENNDRILTIPSYLTKEEKGCI